MKMTLRFAAIILAAGLVLAGCSDNGNQNGSTTEATGNETTATDGSGEENRRFRSMTTYTYHDNAESKSTTRYNEKGLAVELVADDSESRSIHYDYDSHGHPERIIAYDDNTEFKLELENTYTDDQLTSVTVETIQLDGTSYALQEARDSIQLQGTAILSNLLQFVRYYDGYEDVVFACPALNYEVRYVSGHEVYAKQSVYDTYMEMENRKNADGSTIMTTTNGMIREGELVPDSIITVTENAEGQITSMKEILTNPDITVTMEIEYEAGVDEETGEAYADGRVTNWESTQATSDGKTGDARIDDILGSVIARYYYDDDGKTINRRVGSSGNVVTYYTRTGEISRQEIYRGAQLITATEYEY